MAGVTNAPFRMLCRRFGAGLFVSEMVLAAAVVHGNAKTARMTSFAPGESPRSLQLYGTDPHVVASAIRRLVDEGGVDHVDLNFGCPMPKVTRRGGGAAVPLKPRLLRRIVAAAVGEAGAVPVTMKFRIGLDDHWPTYLEAGRIAEGEGCAAVALHARTAEQCYSGRADWAAIAALKEAVTTVPVLGNGDIWVAEDALAMLSATGADGVVVGRGCLGRPWLFRDLVDAFAGRPVRPAPDLGQVLAVLLEHAALLAEWFGERRGIVELRKHAGWYLTGYPVGGEVRRRFATVSTIDEVASLAGALDSSVQPLPGADRMARGHTQGPRRIVLPEGYLEDLDDDRAPLAGDVLVSGG